MVDTGRPSIGETLLPLEVVEEAVVRLRGGTAAGICKISVKLLTDGGTPCNMGHMWSSQLYGDPESFLL